MQAHRELLLEVAAARGFVSPDSSAEGRSLLDTADGAEEVDLREISDAFLECDVNADGVLAATEFVAAAELLARRRGLPVPPAVVARATLTLTLALSLALALIPNPKPSPSPSPNPTPTP